MNTFVTFKVLDPMDKERWIERQFLMEAVPRDGEIVVLTLQSPMEDGALRECECRVFRVLWEPEKRSPVHGQHVTCYMEKYQWIV